MLDQIILLFNNFSKIQQKLTSFLCLLSIILLMMWIMMHTGSYCRIVPLLNSILKHLNLCHLVSSVKIYVSQQLILLFIKIPPIVKLLLLELPMAIKRRG